MYIGVLLLLLLLTIVMICISSSSSSMIIIIQIVLQHHEPSIRIFRCLCELLLLLICTFISIHVYIKYLSYHLTQQLLFESIYNTTTTNTATNDDDDDDEHAEEESMPKATTPTTLNNINHGDDESSSSSSLHDISRSIMSLALDLLLYTCITFLLYLVSAILQSPPSSSLSSSSSSSPTTTNTTTTGTPTIPFIAGVAARIVAPTFPLLLFIFCCIRCIQHYQQYMEFYTILSYTIYAPWYNVTFRDGMIGDILTSMVRPMQDAAFTICYLLFGLRGYWSDHYFDDNDYKTVTDPNSMSLSGSGSGSGRSNNITSFGNSFVESADAYVPSMERSWIVHTAILPACMISPLWWRFLQTLRQSYDYEQRWPYLGNSLKYFIAAQVAMLGVYHPSLRQSTLWIYSFVLATLYQIYWDVFMDWGLLVRDGKRSLWRLRKQQLYPWKSFYWISLIINAILRFCWTLSFVPFHYLSASGVLTNNFSSEAWANILVPTIASAEIIRRTLWGLIRVEWEVIKVKSELSDTNHNSLDDDDHEVEMTPMKVHDSTDTWSSTTQGSSNRYKLPFTSDMSSMNKIQIFGELSLYTATFAVLGLIIAAHRGTL